MFNRFAKRIGPFIREELRSASAARNAGNVALEFQHLENAHVLGQESTYWHTKVHVLMFVWAIRNRSLKELLGQLFRIIGAFTKTVVGLVPEGNTGGSNVSPFKPMPIPPSLGESIRYAKHGG